MGIDGVWKFGVIDEEHVNQRSIEARYVRMVMRDQKGNHMRSMLLALALCVASVQTSAVWGVVDEPKTPENTSTRQLGTMAKESKLTLVQAVGRALEKVSGTAVQVELQKKDQKIVWEVTVFTAKGDLNRVYVDSQDGSYLVPVSPSHGRQ